MYIDVPKLNLGFNVSDFVLLPTNDKNKELHLFSLPKDPKSLRKYLRMKGFYLKVIPNHASIVLPLSKRMRLFPNFSFDLIEAQKNILQKHYTPTLKYNHINISTDFLLSNDIRCCIALNN